MPEILKRLHKHLKIKIRVLKAARSYKNYQALLLNSTVSESQNHRITESQNGRGWKGPLGII